MRLNSSILTSHISTANIAAAVNNKFHQDVSNTSDRGSITGYFKSSVKKDSSKSRIAGLMERKQSILDRKEEKRQSDIEKGYDQKAIEDDLAQYDSMAADIDQQIAEARQEEVKKASHGKTDDTQNNTQSENSSSQDGFNSAAAEKSSKNLQALSSLQATQQNIQAVQYAKRVLKVEALSYQPSYAFAGHPEVSAKLTAKADSAQTKISDMEQNINDAAKSIAANSGDSLNNAQESGTEKYKETEDFLTGDNKNGKMIDVYA